MFGINKTLTKWLMIIVGGAVLICIGVCSGCASVDEVQSADLIEGNGAKKSVTDFDQKQTALAVKNEVDSSHKENHTETHTDNSITVEFKDELENQAFPAATALPPPELPDLPVVAAPQLDIKQVNTIIEANVRERELMIRAGEEAKLKAIQAEYKIKEEKLLTDLAVVEESKSEAIAKITEAKAKMREREILAEGEVQKQILLVKEEYKKWLIWGGIGIASLVVIGLFGIFKAYLAQSPWDKSRKVGYLMAEIDLEKFYDKLNEIKSEFNKGLNAVNLKVAEVIVEFKNLKTHDAPCQFLEDHKKDQSKRSKDIYDKLDEHVKDHHSSNSENTPDKVISEHIEKYHSSNAANTAEKIMSDHVQKEHSAESSDRKKTMLYTALCAIAAVAGVIAGVMIK